MVISFILESEARAQEYSGSLTSCLIEYIVSEIWLVKKKVMIRRQRPEPEKRGMRHRGWLSDTASSNICNKGAHRRIAHTKIMMDRLQSIRVRRYWIDPAFSLAIYSAIIRLDCCHFSFFTDRRRLVAIARIRCFISFVRTKLRSAVGSNAPSVSDS